MKRARSLVLLLAASFGLAGCHSSRAIQAGGVTWTMPGNWSQVTPKSAVTAIQMKRDVLVTFRRWGSMWANTSSGGRQVIWTDGEAKKWQQDTLGFERGVLHAQATPLILHGTSHDSVCVSSFLPNAYTLRCVVLGTTLITHYVGSRPGLEEATQMLTRLK